MIKGYDNGLVISSQEGMYTQFLPRSYPALLGFFIFFGAYDYADAYEISKPDSGLDPKDWCGYTVTPPVIPQTIV